MGGAQRPRPFCTRRRPAELKGTLQALGQNQRKDPAGSGRQMVTRVVLSQDVAREMKIRGINTTDL